MPRGMDAGAVSLMAFFTVGFSAGSVVAVVASSLGCAGNKGCSGGRLGFVPAVPRSGVDKLALVAVVAGTPLGGAGECPSESFAFMAPVPATPEGVACFLKTTSWISSLCQGSPGENLCLCSDSAA